MWYSCEIHNAETRSAAASSTPLNLHAQLIEASFGATTSATIGVYTRNYIRGLSTMGPGLATNYWTDGNSAFNNYGSGYLAALQSMSLGSLRYPGGEKADSCVPLPRCS